MYDFDTRYDKTGLGADKWDGAQAEGCPPGVVPLSVADMEFRAAPEIVAALEELARFGLWGYTHADEKFRAAVIGWMKTRHGWSADPAWLVGTPGVVPALYTAVRAFTAPGDGIIVQPPVYYPFFSAAERNGREIIENPLISNNGRYEIDFDDLRRKAPSAKMLILCSPHNPVGRVWSRDELETLAQICNEHNLLVFSDEIHNDLVFAPHRHTVYATLQNADPNGRYLIGTAASKTFSLAGLSCSSIFIPNEEMRGRFEQQMAEDCSLFNTSFGVAATRAAYTEGVPWMQEMLQYVRANYEHLKDYLAANLPLLRVAELEGTYLAWIDFRALGLDADALHLFLQKEATLYLGKGSNFGRGGEGFERLNLACPRAVLVESLERLSAAIANLPSF